MLDYSLVALKADKKVMQLVVPLVVVMAVLMVAL